MPSRTREAAKKKEKGPEPSENSGAPSLVRGGGIEPPWLLTASTSTAKTRLDSENSWGEERQETPFGGQKRPILAAGGQNSGQRIEVITQALEVTVSEWRCREDRWILFARLAHLMRLVRDES